MCIRALDGKRVLISKPQNSGSNNYAYKGQFNIILLSLVDAGCMFMYVHVGACGRASDGGVWDRFTLKQAMEGQILNTPQPEKLPFSEKQYPYVFVGDEPFL